MPTNPDRARGGDVSGMTAIDVTQGEALQVSKASYDPGYPIDNTLSDARTKFKKADLVTGFCAYGKTIGEKGDY